MTTDDSKVYVGYNEAIEANPKLPKFKVGVTSGLLIKRLFLAKFIVRIDQWKFFY